MPGQDHGPQTASCVLWSKGLSSTVIKRSKEEWEGEAATVGSFWNPVRLGHRGEWALQPS